MSNQGYYQGQPQYPQQAYYGPPQGGQYPPPQGQYQNQPPMNYPQQPPPQQYNDTGRSSGRGHGGRGCLGAW
ncbi:MAG: hypothetical protein M4579_000719 [Chaenotheca gracillima]|nr:MAG: hypothetical protein M4579_000719 [Chaenotheca gracillima]